MPATEPRGHRRPFLARRFESEAGYRRSVELADRHGQPPSRLDGREPAEVTEHEYDAAGRLIRSVTIREPLYTEQDVAELEALQLYRDGLCPHCGRPLSVCAADEAADPTAAQFEVSWRTCRAQRELEEFKRATFKPDSHPNRAAYLLGTTIRKR